MATRDEVNRIAAKRKAEEEKAALRASTTKKSPASEKLEEDFLAELVEVKRRPAVGRTRRRRLSMVPAAAQHRGRVDASGHVGGDGHDRIAIAKDAFFAHALDEGGTSATDRRAAHGETEEALIEDAVKAMERKHNVPRITIRKSSMGTLDGHT